MIALILALLLEATWPTPKPDDTPEPQPIPRELEDDHATTQACDALNEGNGYWDEAYGGVATRREHRQ
jgi:hypothetical protein